MNRPDFKMIGRMISDLQRLEADFRRIFEEGPAQEEQLVSSCRELMRLQAVGSLADIPVEELKNARAGIRTAALEKAGFHTLLDLYRAKDYSLEAVEGIGEKQTAAIRSILDEFLDRLAGRGRIRLTAGNDEKILTLVRELAVYRQAAQIRRDAEQILNEDCPGLDRMIENVAIRSRLRWFFSGRSAKENTILAVGSLIAFIQSPQHERMERFAGLYRQVLAIDDEAAQEDFRKNSAAYYALIEKITGAEVPQELIYSSIPAQLAAKINALELDLSGFKGDLRAYQAFGARYVLTQKRVLLGDEMGLGKTIQAIAVMAHLFSKDPASRFLIVCPASVMINWCREIAKFSSIVPCLLHGKYMEDIFLQWEEKGGAAVTNYESMGKISGRINNRLTMQLLIIDEAHYIKNPQAQRTKNIRLLEDESERILMMTGTPLENKVDEMCELIGFVRPDMVKEVRDSAGMRHVPAFREMLAPVYLRRQRDQVLSELPPLTQEEEWCSMTAQDAAAYSIPVMDRNFPGMRRVSFLQDDMRGSAKARRLLELCSEAREEGRRVVIFSYFRETIRKVYGMLAVSPGGAFSPDGSPSPGGAPSSDMASLSDGAPSPGGAFSSDGSPSSGGAFSPDGSPSPGGSSSPDRAPSAGSRIPSFRKDGYFVGVITGSTPAGERQDLVDRFAEAKGGGILICQVQAGGTGLNIQSAGIVIFCEPQIKPSLTAQAISRVYRMGQVQNVLVFHLLCENTVDEAVMRILDQKQGEFDLFADESVLADAADNLADREWIRQVVEEERRKYLPAVAAPR